MIKDILRVLWVNLLLLPGEAGFTALVMYKEGVLNLGSGVCTLGILFTVNVFITAGWIQHVADQQKIEKQQERIEDA